MSESEKEPVFEECPACLVSLSGDDTINRMAALLQETAAMLLGALAPHTDARDVDAWYEKQLDLRTRIEEIIGPLELD